MNKQFKKDFYTVLRSQAEEVLVDIETRTYTFMCHACNTKPELLKVIHNVVSISIGIVNKINPQIGKSSSVYYDPDFPFHIPIVHSKEFKQIRVDLLNLIILECDRALQKL